MATDIYCRARQTILIQGFCLYTAEAVVAMLLQGTQTFADPYFAWAMEFDSFSYQYTDKLIGVVDDTIHQLMSACAETCRQQNKPGVLLCTAGASLFLSLDPGQLTGCRLKIEQAVIRGKQPPAEKLDAWGDEAIKAEALRRGIIEAKPEPTDVGPIVRAGFKNIPEDKQDVS